MPTRSLFSLMLTLLLGTLLLGANCTLPVDDDDSSDDDDSAGDDDDSAGDDDDSAGDDDDSALPTLPMAITALDVYCEGDPALARAQSGHYGFLLSVEGYATDVKLFMWDGFGIDGNNQTIHFQDDNQPWTMSNTDYSWPDLGQWDEYAIGRGEAGGAFPITDVDGSDVPELQIHDNITDAEANSGTILDCYDGNAQPNVENHNYMVCATDFYDDSNKQCWFCGDDLGDGVFWMGTINQPGGDYEVGLWTDPADQTVYEVTTDITTDASLCVRTSTQL